MWRRRGGGGTGGSSGTTVELETTTDSPQPDHVITQNLFQKNATQIQSAGVALTLKKRLGRRKGSTGLTYSLGPRFVQLEDRYELDYVSFQNTFNTFGRRWRRRRRRRWRRWHWWRWWRNNRRKQHRWKQQHWWKQLAETGGNNNNNGNNNTTGPGGDVQQTFTTTWGELVQLG